MASILTFSGLASGVQWRDALDQIMALEARPADRLREKIDAARLETQAWTAFKARVQALRDAAFAIRGDALRTNRTALAGATSVLASATASPDAAVGTHTVRVLQLAAAETLGGDIFASRTAALGISGELRVGGQRIAIEATDSLDAIVQRFNNANAGGATGVTASILTTGTDKHRIVLTSSKTGAAGIDLVDGADGVLRALGLLDNNVAIKTATTNGARSDAFADSVTDVASLLGFASPPASATVTMGGVDVTIDLAAMSLTDIADAINTAAGLAGRGVSASVIDDNGAKRLDIRGATSFTDANRILEALGVLEAGRSAVAQELRSSVLESAAGTPATAATQLTSLWTQGAQANVQAGDTLSISGTRADGTSFAFDFTIGAGDTIQTLLDRLNSNVDGLQAGSRTATASIDATTGEIVITDDSGGDSRLSLTIVANNENGGTLDFGVFNVATAGRARTITAGRDAELEVNGAWLTRSTNTVNDVVPGLTLSLAGADPVNAVTVSISRDVDASLASVKAMVDAYNQLAEFVDAQLRPPPEGQAAPPLYNDSVLRTMRAQLRGALGASLDATVTGGLSRLPDIGIEIDRSGRYKVDTDKLRSALESNADAVSRLFGEFGTATGSGLSWLQASDKTVPGTYDVDITQAPAAATLASSGFGGSYVDDAAADTLTIRDIASNAQYSVALANGMSLAQIIDAINLELKTAKAHIVTAGQALFDSTGTPADDATLWSDVRLSGGVDPGIADNDVITIAGTRTDGSSFLTSLVIDTTATLGQLRQAVQSALGSDVAVTWENGVLTATAKSASAKQFTLSVSSDNAGGGTLDFGAFMTTQPGRGTSRITATDDGGQLRLTHADAGQAAGFEISYTAGGGDGSASLGLAAGIYTGIDVQGTIGGFAATGSGRTLTGAAGTPIEGLLALYEGTATGAIGTITYSRGLASRLTLASDTLLGTEPGSIQSIMDRIDGTVAGLESRIETIEGRLERRREQLIRRFTAMEQALARAQTQSAWLEAQIQQLQQRSKQR